MKQVQLCNAKFPVRTCGNKNITMVKEQKNRVETATWNVNVSELSHFSQLFKLTTRCNDKYFRLLVSHIKGKLTNYKQQDVLKNKYEATQFVPFDEVVHLLCRSNLRCHYCDVSVYILYEKVRQQVQWTLDRIDNDKGHNVNNVVVACLQCNLKRRRTNKDAFMFSKNMVVKKLPL